MNALFYLFFIVIFERTVAQEECETPTELKLKQEYCWTEEIEVVDRIVQTSKNVLNFARKKLGISVEDENSKQKCEYYFCILRQLHMLNANDYPAIESIQQWTKRNVIYFQAVDLMDQINKCSSALTNSTLKELNFYADQVDNEKTVISDEKSKEQNTCEIAAEFIDCLSRQKQCPVFHYP